MMLDTLFPFGFPFATALYLTVYVLTLVIHVVFMNYVLAGTAYLALTRRRDDSEPLGIRAVIVAWMPVMLSGAITAGIAPLLFVQILYQRSFYTANLLLFHRWMVILPVLIVGFYALYLVQSGWLRRRASWIITAITAVPFLCIAFTGYSWTENHLLSVRSPAEWAAFYESNAILYYEAQLIPRLLLWAFGSIPVFTLVVAWQLCYRGRGGEAILSTVPRTLATLAMIGLLLAALASVVWSMSTDGLILTDKLSPMAAPYFAAALLGWALQMVGWWRIRGGMLTIGRLSFVSIGTLLTLLGMTATRESIRLMTLGEERLTALLQSHQRASEVGGLTTFLIFFVFNAVLIALCFWLVRSGRKTNSYPES